MAGETIKEVLERVLMHAMLAQKSARAHSHARHGAMAGEASKEVLARILMHAMLAQKNLRPQHDHLLQAQRELQQQLKPSDDEIAASLRELVFDDDTDLAEAALLNGLFVEHMDCAVALKHAKLVCGLDGLYHVGIRAAAGPLFTCLEMTLAAWSGALLERSPAFAAMPHDQLFDALVAQRLPAHPTTPTEAFSCVEAAFYAVKLSKEHHLASCIEHLKAKTDISDPAPAAAGEPPQTAASRGVDVDKARDHLDRACTLATLGVKHIDLAVAVISSFLDPKEVAEISEMADENARISDDYFLQLRNLQVQVTSGLDA